MSSATLDAAHHNVTGHPTNDRLGAALTRLPHQGAGPAGHGALDGVIAHGRTVNRSEIPAITESVGQLLDQVEDGYARIGLGFNPGARLGMGVRVPGQPGGAPSVYANTSVVIEDGRWVTDGERAQSGRTLHPHDAPWLRETERGQGNRERTLIFLSDENGEPAELDGPLWFDPDRVYMTNDGRILADVPCLPDSWFDLTEEITGQKRIDPSQAGNLARALLRNAEGSGVGERPPEVERIVNGLAQDSFRVFGAGGTLRPGPVRLATGSGPGEGLTLNLARGPNGELSEVHTEGDLDRLTTRINARFASFDLTMDGTRTYSGPGTAEIEVVTQFHRGADGNYDFSRPPEVSVEVRNFQAENVNLATADGSRLRLGRVEGIGDPEPDIVVSNGQTHVDLAVRCRTPPQI
ncbi:MAG: hypothetical protein AAFQ82_02040, partial [Myxococcota bacterium]